MVIEAEAMGVPVIVSDIPGPRDAMKGNVTGLLTPVKNVEKLYQTMIEIKETYNEKQYTQNCYDFVKNNFDSDSLCIEILNRKKFLLEDYN